MESAVLGLPDETSGQKIIAILKLRKSNLDDEDFNGTYSFTGTFVIAFVHACLCAFSNLVFNLMVFMSLKVNQIKSEKRASSSTCFCFLCSTIKIYHWLSCFYFFKSFSYWCIHIFCNQLQFTFSNKFIFMILQNRISSLKIILSLR